MSAFMSVCGTNPMNRTLASSPPLEAVRRVTRAAVPHLDDDRYFHPDIEAAIGLLRDGAVIAAAGADALPSICGAPR